MPALTCQTVAYWGYETIEFIACYAFASKLFCGFSTPTASSPASGMPLFAFPMLRCRSCTFPSVWKPPHWWYTSSTHYWNKSPPFPRSYRKTLCNRCFLMAVSDISLSLLFINLLNPSDLFWNCPFAKSSYACYRICF